MAATTPEENHGILTPRNMAVVHQGLAIITLVIGLIVAFTYGGSSGDDATSVVFAVIAATLGSAVTLYTISVVLNWLAAYYALAARGFEPEPPPPARPAPATTGETWINRPG